MFRNRLRGDSHHVKANHARRVLLVTSSLEGGGAERVLSEMASFWARAGWCVTLATWSGPDREDFYSTDTAVARVWLNVNIPSSRAVRQLLGSYRRVRKIRRLIEDIKPDAVISFIDWSNVLTILGAFGSRTRTIVSERVHPARYRSLQLHWRLLRWATYRVADCVVAQTEDVARWLEVHCNAQTCVIANPLRALPIIAGNREKQIVSVGRLDHQKGFDILLRSFAKVHTQFESWGLTIVGAGPELANLMLLIDELGLSERVSIRPPVKDIETLLGRAGLVVQASRFEGFPNILLEAMGMGAPVISANCQSGPSEIIEDGVNGRLVPVEDIDALAQAMTELLQSAEQRSELGRNARSVNQTFKQATIMKQWEMCVMGSIENTMESEAERCDR